MYIRPCFQILEEDAFDIIRKQSFAQIIACFNKKITSSYLPLIIDKENYCLYGHMARQNGQVKSLANADDLVVTFLANDAYISPNWYQTEHQVPTWNYQAVEIKGNAILLDDENTLKIIDDLSQYHEAKFEMPWTMDKLSEKKINAMLKAIVGFKIDIVEISGQSKMSQNKIKDDRESIVAGLLSEKDVNSQQVARIMKKDMYL